jgi:HD-like signal output (HDOD) protein
MVNEDDAAEEARLKKRRVREGLLKKCAGTKEMMSLGASITSVANMAASDDKGLFDLAKYVMSDVGLTQRILRMANGSGYRTTSGESVNTITRAISLVGFDRVKSSALSMLLVDKLSGPGHSHAVTLELDLAVCASMVGREMGKRTKFPGAEEVMISSLFKNLGPLLIASHEPDRYREISALIDSGEHAEAQASQMILGSPFDAVCDAVLKEWRMPVAIRRSLEPLPEGLLVAPTSKPEWMRLVASFSHEAAQVLSSGADPVGSREALDLLQRYGGPLRVDTVVLGKIFASVREQLAEISRASNLKAVKVVEAPPAPSAEDLALLTGMGDPDAEKESLVSVTEVAPTEAPVAAPPKVLANLPDALHGAAMNIEEAVPPTFHASGKPTNARDLLLAGVQAATQMRASGSFQVDELIKLVLETLYTSMGFRFALACLKDPKAGQYRGRLAVGEAADKRKAGFAFPLTPARDLFNLAMENDADLMISDALSPKINELLPEWHRKLLPDTRSFIVLPLVVNDLQVGLFYADRTSDAPEGVPPDETSLIKALKTHVVAALGGH